MHQIIDDLEASTTDVEITIDDNTRFEQFLAHHRRIKDKDVHIALQNALIEHLWKKHSNSND